MSIALALSLVLAVFGLALVAVGLRGRRVDDHPLCRRCRFDLSGMPATSDRCPECGADVRAARGTVVGHRQRYRGRLVAGLLLAVVGLASLGVVGFLRTSHFDWAARRPTWYALREARGQLPGDAADATALLIARSARGELAGPDDRALTALLLDAPTPARLTAAIARITHATFTPEHHRRLVDHLVAVHRDRPFAWDPKWGAWLAGEIFAGRVDVAPRDAFLTALVGTHKLTVRPDVRQGEGLYVNQSFDFTAVGDTFGRGLVARQDSRDRRLIVDGVAREVSANRGHTTSTSGLSGKGSSGNVLTADDLGPLAPGRRALKVRGLLRFRDGHGEGASELASMPYEDAVTFTVHPRDATLVRRVADEAQRAAVRAGITVSPIRVGTNANSLPQLEVKRGVLPVGVAFDVVIRQGGRTIKAGTLAAPAGAAAVTHAMSTHERGLVPGTAQVTLVPSETAALWTIDVFTIWDGELTYEVEVVP